MAVASPHSLHWRHNDHDGISSHQPHGYLLNRLFRRRSKKTSKLRVTGLCVGIQRDSPHKMPVTRKMFPFDDVIMLQLLCNSLLWTETKRVLIVDLKQYLRCTTWITNNIQVYCRIWSFIHLDISWYSTKVKPQFYNRRVVTNLTE